MESLAIKRLGVNYGSDDMPNLLEIGVVDDYNSIEEYLDLQEAEKLVEFLNKYIEDARINRESKGV